MINIMKSSFYPTESQTRLFFLCFFISILSQTTLFLQCDTDLNAICWERSKLSTVGSSPPSS